MCIAVYRLSAVTTFLAIALVIAAHNPARAQEPDDGLDGDVPEWLEGFGYDHGAAEQMGDESDLEQLEAESASSDHVPAAAAQGQCQCLRCRQHLTGDWGGHRTRLQQRGIFYRGRVTQFFTGVSGGIQPPVLPAFAALGISGGNTYEYTGNSRHDFVTDLEKFGGPAHGKFIVTLEDIWGRWGNTSLETGATTPSQFSAAIPVDPAAEGIPRLTNFLIAQPLSEHLVVTVGKTRFPSVADNNIFAGGDGSDQFLNQTFCVNPLFITQIPVTTFAVGAVSPQPWGNVSITVLDPRERSTDYFQFGDLFAEGVTIFSQLKVNTKLLGKAGQHHFGGYYKQVDLIDLRFKLTPPEYPYPPAPPGLPALVTRPDSYTLFYGFDQYISEYSTPDSRGRATGWGIFGRAGLSDNGTGNPNFGAWHLSGGIGGDSPLASRRGKGDRFGIGYGFTATSSEWGALPIALFGPRDSQVVEAFYRYQITPAIDLSPDLQWIRGNLGGLTNGGDAFVYGLRLNMRL